MNQEIEPATGVLTNTLYIMSQAMDIMLRDLERRLKKNHRVLNHEQKRNFSRFIEYVRLACIHAEDLCQDIYNHEAKRNYKDVQLWQEQSNELARLVLLFSDRSRYVNFVEEIFKHIESFEGDGIITEDILKNYYLKKPQSK